VKTRSTCLVLLVGLFLWPGFLSAQSKGRITGRVVDASTGEPLFGVNILITGTTRGTTTDFEGAYAIPNLDAGVYTVMYRYITYATQTVTEITVADGRATVVDIALEPDAIGLSEVTVTATANRQTSASLLSIQRGAVSMQDGISLEQISRSGLGNVAEAMTKVTGASVVGGKYVFVRGLGDRYSSTHLNGMELPSADPDKKAFQLDLIPSRLLDNVITLKTFTADRPGNFSGGLVDVSTKQFPDNFSFSFSMSTAYNDRSSLTDGLLPRRSSTDWLGYDDGLRALPALLSGDRAIPNHIEAQFDRDKARQLDELTRSFRPEMVPANRTIPVDRSFGLSMGSQFTSPIGQFGYVLGGSYKNSFSSYSDGRVGIYKLVGGLTNATELVAVNDMDDSRSTMDVDIGLLGSLSYRPSKANRFTVNYIRTQSGSSTGREISGFWDEADEGGMSSYESRVLEYTQRSLESVHLMGRHMVEAVGNISLDWNVSLARNTQEQPDLRYFENGIQETGAGDRTYSLSSGLFQRPARFFRDLEESNQIASVDVTYPVSTSSGDFKFKGGLFIQGVDRLFTENRFDINQGRSSKTFSDFDLDWNRFFAHAGLVDSTSSRFIFGNYLVDATSPKNSYDADSETRAAYLMMEAPLGNLKLVAGARVENATIRAASRDTLLPVGQLENTDWLPSVTAIYALTESMNLRLAYTHTVARPTFRELAPYATFDFYGSFVFTGNDTLVRTLIRNMDARYEWYPNPGEILALSVFYKDLQNPIERAIRPQVNKNMTVQNVEAGRVYGLELEVRKNLGFLSESLRRFSVTTNLTFVRSFVDIPDDELFTIRVEDPNAASTRQLVGQSPYIFNLDLNYTHEESGFGADLTINRFSDRMHAVSLGAAPDVYERGVTNMNFLMRKSFGNLEFSATLGNLLNSTQRFTQEFKGQSYPTLQYASGRTYSVGISYGF
jgi:outer membrane receptor protein involved in Fe transport